jgi:uncharacterized protein
MRITCDRAKREQALLTRGLDMLRAKEVFAGPHFTRPDERHDYGEPRFITVGWLDERLVVFAWTPRGVARRVFSIRHCHEREATKVRTHLATL